MKRSADEPLTRELARDVSLRNGIKAFVVGAIDGIESRYLITLEAVEAESGDVIGRTQIEARGRGAGARLAAPGGGALRARLGESLTSIRRFDPPVDRVTTASLPALQELRARPRGVRPRATARGHSAARSRHRDRCQFRRGARATGGIVRQPWQ